MLTYPHETWGYANMGSLTAELASWAWAIWMGAAFVVGGAMLLRDELRLHRTRPKPEDVRAYADQLEAAHGRDAYLVNGEAMHTARVAGEFDRYRFLKAVSCELISRWKVDLQGRSEIDIAEH